MEIVRPSSSLRFPTLMSAAAVAVTENDVRSAKRPFADEEEAAAAAFRLYRDRLPCSVHYEWSYMHRDTVLFVAVASSLNTVITLSADAIVKFWRKTDTNIELLRYFRCHTAAPLWTSMSVTQRWFATVGADRTIKIFDVATCELVNCIDLSFEPLRVALCDGGEGLRVLCLEVGSNVIRVFDALAASSNADSLLFESAKVHRKPVLAAEWCTEGGFFISIDAEGIIEYFSANVANPLAVAGVDFNLKSDTDLFAVAKAKASPIALAVSADGTLFAVRSSDWRVRIFTVRSGRLLRCIDESPEALFGAEINAKNDAVVARIAAAESEIPAAAVSRQTLLFDANGKFLVYATFSGINLRLASSNEAFCEEFDSVIAFKDRLRFVAIALYQGRPRNKTLTVEMAASDNPAFKHTDSIEACFVATALNKNRFYIVSRRDPPFDEVNGDENTPTPAADRDVCNEVVVRGKGAASSAAASTSKADSALEAFVAGLWYATIHTTKGDVRITLFGDRAPRTVENFVTLAQRGFYDGLRFFRVIKDFMVQTGDPLNNGTGGQSIWDSEFADEFDDTLNHDEPFMMSMANAGPNTNGNFLDEKFFCCLFCVLGSQFFITVVPAAWLNQKHTVFGKVTAGFETVMKISNLKTNKADRPYETVSIINIETSRKAPAGES